MNNLPNAEDWIKVNGISLGIILFIIAFGLFIFGIFTWQLAASGGLIFVLGCLIIFVTAILRDV